MTIKKLALSGFPERIGSKFAIIATTCPTSDRSNQARAWIVTSRNLETGDENAVDCTVFGRFLPLGEVYYWQIFSFESRGNLVKTSH